MSIHKYVQYLIGCDGCASREADYDNCTQAEAIELVREDGWYIGRNHLCPECVKMKFYIQNLKKECRKDSL